MQECKRDFRPVAQNSGDSVYSTKAEDQVSWYQENPEPSLGLINSVAPDKNAAILDVGGGARGWSMRSP